MRQDGYLQDLYRDARSEKHKIMKLSVMQFLPASSYMFLLLPSQAIHRHSERFVFPVT
jgi:hypothetical protein